MRLAAHYDGYAAETPSGTILARQAVLATGPFQRPRVREVAQHLAEQARDEVVQLHSSRYRRPNTLPGGPVLVVGGGNSGVQIAAELCQTHPTTLAVGSRLPYLPQRLAGRRPIFWWLDHLGLMTVPTPPPIGPWWRARGFLIGCTPARLRDRDVTLTDRVIGAERGQVRCRTAPCTGRGRSAGDRLRPGHLLDRPARHRPRRLGARKRRPHRPPRSLHA
jgi:putative flavoprotein involved in K+ transport